MFASECHFLAPALLLLLGNLSHARASQVDAWGRVVYTECEWWGMPADCDKDRPMEERLWVPFYTALPALPVANMSSTPKILEPSSDLPAHVAPTPGPDPSTTEPPPPVSASAATMSFFIGELPTPTTPPATTTSFFIGELPTPTTPPATTTSFFIGELPTPTTPSATTTSFFIGELPTPTTPSATTTSFFRGEWSTPPPPSATTTSFFTGQVPTPTNPSATTTSFFTGETSTLTRRSAAGLKACRGPRDSDRCTGVCNTILEPGRFNQDTECLETNGRVLFSVCERANVLFWRGACRDANTFTPLIRDDGTHVYDTPDMHILLVHANPENTWAKFMDGRLF
jgi:hypothetical protein